MGRDKDLFAAAMRDVVPIEKKERIAPKRAAGRGAVEAGEASSERDSGRFTIERWGENVTGLARGQDSRLPGRLRSYEGSVDLRVDLHGFDLRSGEECFESAMDQMWQSHGRYLLVIHGRGLRSQGGPVLKRALVGWLESSRHAARVMSFSTASSALGGTGATLVKMKRRGRG